MKGGITTGYVVGLEGRYPKLKSLQGLMTKYDITVTQMAKHIGKSPSTVSKCNNGHIVYDSVDMVNIRKLINEKSSKIIPRGQTEPRVYSIEEIFEEIFLP